MVVTEFRSEQTGTRSQVGKFGHHLHGLMPRSRRTPAEAKARRAEKAQKATAEEYNAAELRVFKEKWAKMPPGKHAWPSVTKAEVLAELAKKGSGGRRRTRRGRGSRYTRRR